MEIDAAQVPLSCHMPGIINNIINYGKVTSEAKQSMKETPSSRNSPHRSMLCFSLLILMQSTSSPQLTSAQMPEYWGFTAGSKTTERNPSDHMCRVKKKEKKKKSSSQQQPIMITSYHIISHRAHRDIRG